MKELSPAEALFLLQFQYSENNSKIEGKQILHQKLEYIPHKLLHRYSRTSNQLDLMDSRIRFREEILKVDKAFFCHIEHGKSHAFIVKKDKKKVDGWILLDSLREIPLEIPESFILFQEHQFAGRASVMILRDISLPSKILWEKKKEVK